ncbi:MAG: cytochrome b N-terminal domain-containing protein [Anaerolineales bacterium]|nr:cytochrome b N-terminal domain-containing protein [Anaerolineales bacterium]
MRDIHRLGAEMMVLIVTAHMVRTYLTGSYKAPRQFTWFTGVILLVLTLFLSFSGYLLPWDQLAFWAVTIGTSMAEAVPPKVVGETVNLLARRRTSASMGCCASTCCMCFSCRWRSSCSSFAHYYKVVHFGISLPSNEEEVGQDTANKVPADRSRYFLPDVMIDETAFLIVFTALMVSVTALLLLGAAGVNRQSAVDALAHGGALVFLLAARDAQDHRQGRLPASFCRASCWCC